MNLFNKYPALKGVLPHKKLGTFPTPIKKLKKLGEYLNCGNLYSKQDGLSGNDYGGNKVRKLEFLLGNAITSGAKEVLTFGCAGSNHAAATAVYAQKIGMSGISILLPQPNAYSVRKNLLLSYASGAELHYFTNSQFTGIGTYTQLMLHRLKTGREPMVIPAGGSAPLGVAGFVNAALELEEQVSSGQMPEPDYIFLPMGTCGTAAGLILGLKLTRLKTKVIPVRVTNTDYAHETILLKLIYNTWELLHALYPELPRVEIGHWDIGVRHDCYGEKYALYTPESARAVHLAKEMEGIGLEGTYTGKAFSAIMKDGKKGLLKSKTVLFWNTYNSVDFTEKIKNTDYHELPETLHEYFEKEVQPLDQNPYGKIDNH